jgi:hypothetical protein
MTRAGKQPEQHICQEKHGEVGPHNPVNGKRYDTGATAENPEDIKQVTANDIADGHSTLTLTGGDDAGGQFRK